MKVRALLLTAMILSYTTSPAWSAVDFVKDIKPIFEASCLKCHNAAKKKGGVRMDTKEEFFKGGKNGPVVQAGKSAESSLYKAVMLGKKDEDRMPPEGDPLAKPLTDKLKAWIDEGAKWPDGVTLKSTEETGTVEIKADPGLPITPAEKTAVEKLQKAQVLAMRLAQNTNWLRVDFSLHKEEAKAENLALLKDCANLQELNLGGTKITNDDLKLVASCPNLTQLYLQNTKITDAGLVHLKGLTKLTWINLYGSEVTDAGLEHLKGLKLKKIYLWQTKVTEDGAKKLSAAIPGIVVDRGYEATVVTKPDEKKPEEKKPEPKKPEEKKPEPKKPDPKKPAEKKPEPKKESK